MSKRGEKLGLTVSEAECACLNTIKHIAWVLSTPGMTIERARAYVDAFIDDGKNEEQTQ